MNQIKAKKWLFIGLAVMILGGTLLQQKWSRPAGAEDTKKEDTAQKAASSPAASTSPSATPAPSTAPASANNAAQAELPNEAGFKPVAESTALRLLADSTTGHFEVIDKRSGDVWRSYPNPETWGKDDIGGTWRNNLRSPIMVEYIDMSNFKSQPKIISLIEDKGKLEGFQTTAKGFKATFNFTGTGFKIPVEVTLNNDYVQTHIDDKGITEGKLSLMSVKLYPSFGAEQSLGQEGYLFVPDGSGALIRFDPARKNQNVVYAEQSYGWDASFYSDNTGRLDTAMPVFGMKSGNKAFIAIMDQGEEYARAFASPSGSYGQSNWITAEQVYRSKFWQSTSRKKETGFFTYGKERFSSEQGRTVRYYILAQGSTDYVGMAAKYRDYLTVKHGLNRIVPAGTKVPLVLDLMGADYKSGFFKDTYLKGTSTSEAAKIVKSFYGLGVDNMIINYYGWQQGGYSSFGGLFPVDKRLGGSQGMKQFIDFAHSMDFPVYLAANYSVNSNGKDGFDPKYNGLRNLSGKIVEYTHYASEDKLTIVGPKFEEKVILQDLEQYKALGADGILFEHSIGSSLNSDYNDRDLSSRSETLKSQLSILKKTREMLGGAAVKSADFFALDSANLVYQLADDYSHDLFVDGSVPFAQIALHGLVGYTSNYANNREGFKNDFLRSIEYGANPSFIFTYAKSKDMKGAYSANYPSMNYLDWQDQAIKEYQRFNEALGDVQGSFIVGHRTLAQGVKETTYENGKRIIVNYNLEPYTGSGFSVPAQDFIAVKGGATK